LALSSDDEKCFINSTGLAVLMDHLLVPIKDRSITLVHSRRTFAAFLAMSHSAISMALTALPQSLKALKRRIRIITRSTSRGSSPRMCSR